MKNGILLKSVLYVLDFHLNLISVRKLCVDTGCQVYFNTHMRYIQHPLKMKSWLLGRISHGLYQFDEK